jgi:hypothetical protein
VTGPFESALKDYHDSRRPPKSPGSMGPDGRGNRNTADTKLLNHWIDDPRAEGTWKTIRHHAPDLTPVDLIERVLRARRSAEGSVARKFDFFDPEWAAYAVELKDRVKMTSDLLRAPPAALDPLEAAEGLAWLAYELERTARGYRWLADDIRTLHQRYLGAPDQVPPASRQGPRDERARAAFVELLSGFLRERTGRETLGKELLEAIAELTDIAIPGKEPDPESIARRRRRQRPKT